MSMEAQLLAQLVDAIAAEAARIAEKPVALVSVTFDWIGPAAEAAASVEITRATRTMVFSSGQLRSGDRLVAAATAVHRIES
jgi:hypothetical protein